MSAPKKKAKLRQPGLCDDCVQWPAAFTATARAPYSGTWQVCTKCRKQGERKKCGLTYGPLT